MDGSRGISLAEFQRINVLNLPLVHLPTGATAADRTVPECLRKFLASAKNSEELFCFTDSHIVFVKCKKLTRTVVICDSLGMLHRRSDSDFVLPWTNAGYRVDFVNWRNFQPIANSMSCAVIAVLFSINLILARPQVSEGFLGSPVCHIKASLMALRMQFLTAAYRDKSLEKIKAHYRIKHKHNTVLQSWQHYELTRLRFT